MEHEKTKKEITIDDLAVMVQNGFLSVEEKIGNLDGKVGRLESKVDNLESSVRKLETEVTTIKDDIKDIKTDMNKKVDVFTHKSLEYRVEKLEEARAI